MKKWILNVLNKLCALIPNGKEKRKKDIKEPIKRLERLLILEATAIGYFFIYIYQNIFRIQVPLISVETLYKMPIMGLLIFPLIRYIVIKPDCLQRSPSNKKAIKFFQSEFPSKYLLERCKRCIENEKTCLNYINTESRAHIRHWFHNLFHKEIKRDNEGILIETYEKGYICKVLYYSSWILGLFSVFALLSILFHYLYSSLLKNQAFDVSPLQIIYPSICTFLIFLINILNKPDMNAPSGCWQAWREINRTHISWLKSHEDLLKNIICKEGGGNKVFSLE